MYITQNNLTLPTTEIKDMHMGTYTYSALYGTAGKEAELATVRPRPPTIVIVPGLASSNLSKSS